MTAAEVSQVGAMAAETILSTRGLSKRYGRVTALIDLTMEVHRGEVFGFLGPNGAGKTTAVKLLLGLSRPSGGEGRLLGRPLGDRRARRRVGYLPELFRYQGFLRASEVVRLHCRLAGLPRSGWNSEVDRVLGSVGLSGRASDRVDGFSKGMQQRLGLGVALVGDPELVVLDEPTSALDPVGRHDVRLLIRDLARRGTTVFLNSHLLSEVELVCDQVAIVDQGRVIAQGSLDELRGGGEVALRAEGLEPDDIAGLAGIAALENRDGWLVANGLAEDRIPDLVAAIVQRGGRVYAVVPRRTSLEDRFLALLGGEPR
jgi:ABC-2 type transport system ATP-binding protein